MCRFLLAAMGFAAINDVIFFLVCHPETAWNNNSPSVWHGQSASLAFADGHSERWKWLSLKVDQGYGASAATSEKDLMRVQNAIYTP